MQQNASLLYRRAPFVARFRPCTRSTQPFVFSSLPTCAHHRIERRWASSTPTRGGLLGDLPFAHLGGQHYFQVKIPYGARAGDIDAWLHALDTCLPVHLHSKDGGSSSYRSDDVRSTRRDVALVLIQAQQDVSLNLLEYLGAVQQRWDIVAWIVELIAQPGRLADVWADSAIGQPIIGSKGPMSLDEYTTNPGLIIAIPPHNRGGTLDQTTIDTDPRFYDTRLQRGAMGQVWHAIGQMIIQAAEDTGSVQMIMPNVLSLLATLHHFDMVPESVYREGPLNRAGAVQQPPLLHMLWPKISTVLADAAWDARQAVMKKVEKSGNERGPGWSFGLVSPGTRYRPSAQALRPEMWLELVLWSCLRGGWVEEGAALLTHIMRDAEDTDHEWKLISWQKVIDSSNARQAYRTSFGWRDALDVLEGARPELQPRPSADEKASVVRTVSSEVVAAYVDALIGFNSVGVGQRGMPMRTIVDHVWQSKKMLIRQNLGLGFATWDVIIQRFLESSGVWLERDPRLAKNIVRLADPFGREQQLQNVLGYEENEPSSPYFIDASALSLNVLHRILYTHARSGNVEATIAALKGLQDFTELNQRRSITQFFRKLKQRPQPDQAGAKQARLFDTGLAATEYPSFYPQLPAHVIAEFLDVSKNIEDTEFSRWVFDSGSAVGPLISPAMYEETGLAPALVRFASATDNQSILEKVMIHHSQLSQNSNALIPTPILAALVTTLIRRRKWDSVRALVQSFTERDRDDGANFLEWAPHVLPVMVRELLRIESAAALDSEQSDEVYNLLMDLVFTSLHHLEMDLKHVVSNTLYFNVALLAAVDKHWGTACNNMKVLPSRSIWLPTDAINMFNIVLEGVLETRGLVAAKKYWQSLCYTALNVRRNVRQDGYLYVPRQRLQMVEESRASPKGRARVTTDPAHRIDIAGRVSPNLFSVRLLQKALQVDKDSRRDLLYDHWEMRDWLQAYAEALSHVEDASDGMMAQLEDALEV